MDTGASFCIFGTGIADALGPGLTSGTRKRFQTANSEFEAYGHELELIAFGVSTQSMGYFFADRIKSISPVSWKHVNFYGEYNFRDPGEIVDLDQLASRLAALEWNSADSKQPN